MGTLAFGLTPTASMIVNIIRMQSAHMILSLRCLLKSRLNKKKAKNHQSRLSCKKRQLRLNLLISSSYISPRPLVCTIPLLYTMRFLIMKHCIILSLIMSMHQSIRLLIRLCTICTLITILSIMNRTQLLTIMVKPQLNTTRWPTPLKTITILLRTNTTR